MSKPDLSRLPVLVRLAIRLGILRPIPVPVDPPASARKPRPRP
jgi:hypothetical protein